MTHEETPFIRANGRELVVGDVEFEIRFGEWQDDEICGGRPYHSLMICIDPADEQVPRLVMMDVDLYVDGDTPDVLDGLRLDQSLEDGDFGEFAPPWIRPGSTVGTTTVVFEPLSVEQAGKSDLAKNTYATGRLQLSLDRHADELWRIHIRVGHEACEDGSFPAGDFEAIAFAPLVVAS